MRSLLLFVFFVVMISGCSQKKSLPDLRETYAANDKKPFGADIAKREIQLLFPQSDFEILQTRFSEQYTEEKSAYISISRNLALTDDDLFSMLEYVESGNTVIAAAANIDTALLSALSVEVAQNEWIYHLLAGNYQNASIVLAEQPARKYSYYYLPFSSYFNDYDISNTRVSGYNKSNQPNLIEVPYGEGKFILHCDPRAFSNYFLLSHDNHEYFEQVLKPLRETVPSTIYWDDFYRRITSNRKQKESFSSLEEMFKIPQFNRALLIFFTLLVLFVIFESRRRQRIIPALPKNVNNSVAFTETIARLYLQQKDNKNIAHKMITYFNEYIRNKFFFKGNHFSKDDVVYLSRKSGIPAEEVEELFNSIIEVTNALVVDDRQLLKLHQQVHNFFKSAN